MVRIDQIREANAKGKQITGLVGVFPGGTGGIGENTAKELFKRTVKPRIYIIGRDEARGNKVINELHEINQDGEAFFIQKDCSLMRNVDEVCDYIKSREPSINCLFLTAGYMTLKGRSETIEGMDKKMAVNYYSRVRFMTNFLPQLTVAAERGELSRAISVLAAGSEGDIRTDDLDLKHNYTLHACLAHCVVMTDFIIEELAKRHPATAFSHSYPGTVKTGIANELTGPVRLAVKVLYAVMTPWILNVKESGERHFFQISNKVYPSRNGSVGIEPPEGVNVMKGTDGVVGSGAYLLDWDGKAAADEKVLNKYRDMGMVEEVWKHTMEMFQQADRLNPKSNKRPAAEEAEGSGRLIPNPVGWRAA